MMGNPDGGGLQGARMYGGRAGARMYGNGALGAKMFGGGGAKMYGNGNAKAAKMFGGMMPGEYMIPHAQVLQAMHNYKTVHNLHGRGFDGVLPTVHTHKLLNGFLGDDSQELRGGLFGFLAPALGAALPFIAEGVKGLIGGFSRRSGERLAGGGMMDGRHYDRQTLFGAGVPIPVHINGQKHWHVHGEGFKDLMKRAWKKVTSVFNSNPVKQLGAQAAKVLREAITNAIIGKVNELSTAALGKVDEYGNKAQAWADKKFATDEPNQTTQEDMETPQTVEDEAVVASGSGIRKRKAPGKRVGKRAKVAFDMNSLY